jgi:predicted permease
MELIAGLAAVIAPVFLISGAGFVWRRLGYHFDQVFMTNLVTLIGAPCLIFSTFTTAKIPFAEAGVMIEATLACLSLFALVATIGLRMAGMPLRVYLPSLVFPNIGNLGLPVCLFAFGERGLALAMVFFAVTTIGQFTLGPAIAIGRLDPARLLKIPFIYAIALALAVSALDIHVPQWIAHTASLAGGLMVPLMLMSLGAALADFRAASLWRAFIMSAARLTLGTLVGFVIAALFGLDGVQRGVVVVQSAMPVAVFNYIFAAMYDNQPDEVAGMVLVSTLLAFLGLPVLVAAMM